MAGNSLTPQLVLDSSNMSDMYLIHGDEADHSGIHTWKISRMSTVRQQQVILNYPSAYVTPTVNYIDLMAGLPFDDSLTNNTMGWTKSPVFNVKNNAFTDTWDVNTSVMTYKENRARDIQAKFAKAVTTTNTLSRDLGSITATNDWQIAGQVSWGGEANNAATAGYIRVLDDAGKVLARLYILGAGLGTSATVSVLGNGSVIGTGLRSQMSYTTGVLNNFSINYVGGLIYFTYAGYTTISTTKLDATANALKPKTLQLHFTSQTGVGAMNNKSIDISGARLYVDVL
jgi:hypothetical protein